MQIYIHRGKTRDCGCGGQDAPKRKRGKDSYVNVEQIKSSYAPYNRYPEFQQGYDDYMAGRRSKELDGVAGQAYDRGYEAGMKVKRALEWEERNVGAN